jgi:NAD(P)-dependent dehydrogenase (short-subunit alcohol dehydrogenase family)
VVLITGAGRGLGRALARALAARGDTVVAIGRSEADLAETATGCDPTRLRPMVADVRDEAALRRIAEDVHGSMGRIDGLFANAAIYPRGRIHEQDADEALDVFAVNVIGVANAIKAVLPAMMQRAHGRIVVVGSFADSAPLPDSWAYSASKGALHAVVKSTATEVHGDFPDILVNEWVPGALRTKMGIADGLEPDVAAQWGLNCLDLPPGGPTGQLFSGDRLVSPQRSPLRRLLGKLGL